MYEDYILYEVLKNTGLSYSKCDTRKKYIFLGSSLITQTLKTNWAFEDFVSLNYALFSGLVFLMQFPFLNLPKSNFSNFNSFV